jgi:streptogramin lyase
LLVLMLTPLMVGGPLTLSPYALDATSALTEWTIPTPDSQPSGLALDPSGKCCWFVESRGNKVAHLDLSTNRFREWTIPTPDSNPTSLTLTMISGSIVVFGVESAKHNVFLFFPDTGAFREYTLPEDVDPQYISTEPGPSGTGITAWFTALKGGSVGEITYDPNSRLARLYQLRLPPAAGVGAKGVYALSGTVWFAGATGIVKWDMQGKQFTTWSVPSHPSIQPAFVNVDALGQVWFASTSPSGASSNYVAVLRSDNTFTEWQVPTVGADVRALSINPRTQNPWIAESGQDKIAELDPSSGGIVTASRPTTSRFDPVAGAIFTHVAGPVLPSTVTVAPETSAPSMSSREQFTEWTLASGSRPLDVKLDDSGDAWILESSNNKVARLSLRSDFFVECDPSSLLIVQGTNGTSTCTVSSIDGFTSAVELSGSWSGTEANGVVYTLPTPVTPPPSRDVASTLIISAGPIASTGTFTFQVTGISGSLTHAANLTVTIASGLADFTIMASPTHLSIVPGASATAAITIQSLGVFFSPVELTSSGQPDGMRVVFGTTPITPPIGGTVSSPVTVTLSGAPTGTHTITITGISGSLSHSTTIAVEIPGTGPCLIATATYGSELSDEVQFLRNFRDRSIMKTIAGSNFMVAFNAFYYSFSPTVAQFIREHQTVRTVMKFALYPLMGVLRIGAAVFDLFPMNHEAGAIASGLLVSSLIGLVYLTGPLTVVLVYSSRARRVARRSQVPTMAVLFSAIAAVAFITVLGAPAVVTMAATSTIVLAGMAASALLASRAMIAIAAQTRIRKRIGG